MVLEIDVPVIERSVFFIIIIIISLLLLLLHSTARIKAIGENGQPIA